MEQINVGIVDDHRIFRQGIKALLNSNENFEVTLDAESGKDCLGQLNSVVPDVLLLDLDMPEMDGIETLEAILKKDIPSKIIILSMHQEEALILHMIEKGAHGYLLKSASYEEISTAIQEVVSNGYYYNSAVINIMRNGLKIKKRKTVRLHPQIAFTEREIEVLELICKEKTAQEIADALFLSQRTIEGYKKNLLEKTNARNTTGVIIYCLKHGIIELANL